MPFLSFFLSRHGGEMSTWWTTWNFLIFEDHDLTFAHDLLMFVPWCSTYFRTRPTSRHKVCLYKQFIPSHDRRPQNAYWNNSLNRKNNHFHRFRCIKTIPDLWWFRLNHGHEYSEINFLLEIPHPVLSKRSFDQVWISQVMHNISLLGHG